MKPEVIILIITNIVFLIIFKDTIDVYIKYR